MALWWCCYTYCVCMTRIKTNLSRGSSEWLHSVGLDFFFILCCLEGLWGHWVEYTVWVCNSAYRNRSLLQAYFKLRCEPDYLKEHDKLLFVLLGFGLTKSPLVWFGHWQNCKLAANGQRKTCWPERDKPLSCISTCASLKISDSHSGNAPQVLPTLSNTVCLHINTEGLQT